MRRIEMLLSAADAGSFAKAARLLRVDPSAVSHAVAGLEKDLGVRLFQRTTRQLRLTHEGEEVCERGRRILRELSELQSAALGESAKLTGTLRIGMGAPFSRHVIMPRLGAFLRRHPGLRIECLAITQIRDMHAGGVEVMVKPGALADSGLVANRIGDFRFGVYAAPSYLRVAGEPTHPDELARHRCLVHKPPSEDRPWDVWRFERRGVRRSIKVPRTLVTDDREGLIAATMAGSGLMRIGLFDPALIRSGDLTRVLKDWRCDIEHSVHVLYRPSDRRSPKIAAFLEFVGEAFRDFDPEEVTFVHNPDFARQTARAGAVLR